MEILLKGGKYMNCWYRFDPETHFFKGVSITDVQPENSTSAAPDAGAYRPIYDLETENWYTDLEQVDPGILAGVEAEYADSNAVFPPVPETHPTPDNKYLEESLEILRQDVEATRTQIDGVQAEVSEIHGQPDYVYGGEEVTMGYKHGNYPVFRRTFQVSSINFTASTGTAITVATIPKFNNLMNIETAIYFYTNGESAVNDSTVLKVRVKNSQIVITPLALSEAAGGTAWITIYYTKTS
jgi:hypothetical protein